MLFTYFDDPEKNLLEWVQKSNRSMRFHITPGRGMRESALNVWNVPEHMGPPRGLWWLLDVLPTISPPWRAVFNPQPIGDSAT
jgi:hypothetical protein